MNTRWNEDKRVHVNENITERRIMLGNTRDYVIGHPINSYALLNELSHLRYQTNILYVSPMALLQQLTHND